MRGPAGCPDTLHLVRVVRTKRVSNPGKRANPSKIGIAIFRITDDPPHDLQRAFQGLDHRDQKDPLRGPLGIRGVVTGGARHHRPEGISMILTFAIQNKRSSCNHDWISSSCNHDWNSSSWMIIHDALVHRDRGSFRELVRAPQSTPRIISELLRDAHSD